MNLVTWLLEKLSPVPTLDYARVKDSCKDDETKRVHKFDGDPWRHRIRRPELVKRRRGIAGRF